MLKSIRNTIWIANPCLLVVVLFLKKIDLILDLPIEARNPNGHKEEVPSYASIKIGTGDLFKSFIKFAGFNWFRLGGISKI